MFSQHNKVFQSLILGKSPKNKKNKKNKISFKTKEI